MKHRRQVPEFHLHIFYLTGASKLIRLNNFFFFLIFISCFSHSSLLPLLRTFDGTLQSTRQENWSCIFHPATEIRQKVSVLLYKTPVKSKFSGSRAGSRPQGTGKQNTTKGVHKEVYTPQCTVLSWQARKLSVQ